jgi:hypothetical protein
MDHDMQQGIIEQYGEDDGVFSPWGMTWWSEERIMDGR